MARKKKTYSENGTETENDTNGEEVAISIEDVGSVEDILSVKDEEVYVSPFKPKDIPPDVLSVGSRVVFVTPYAYGDMLIPAGCVYDITEEKRAGFVLTHVKGSGPSDLVVDKKCSAIHKAH